jgi:hypothetical protein
MALGDYLSGDQRNAYEALNNLFTGFGLGSLAPTIYDYITKGYSADTIGILLQDTPEYKQRFAGNEARKRAGLPVLSPAEYLSIESSYRQAMRQGGMPEGFYDSADDFNNLIGKDVSPSELKQRVDAANQASVFANPGTQRALQDLYGIDQSHIAAYFLDPERATPLLLKQVQAAQIGGEALKRGLEVDKNFLEYTVGAGTTQAQAAQAYAQIAQELPQYQQISHQYGEEFAQRQMEYGLLEPNTTGFSDLPDKFKEPPTATMERLASWNRARAQGAKGGAETGFARSSSGMV